VDRILGELEHLEPLEAAQRLELDRQAARAQVRVGVPQPQLAQLPQLRERLEVRRLDVDQLDRLRVDRDVGSLEADVLGWRQGRLR
jgi:hypothetical protein